jgi:hypothetical protein
MKELALLMISALCAVLPAAAAAAEGVVDPHVRTDRSVDTRSARTIIRDVVRPGMSDEEKVLALFHWVRRVIFHSGPEEPVRHDFNRMINGFGYGSCYMQTHPLAHLYQQLGYPCRNWQHNGHHMMEVYYGGAWHCLDPHMTFYVYNRASPRAIASVAELQEDSTLAGDAVREGRAGQGFLLCGDAPTWFSGKDGWLLDHPFTPHVGGDEEFGALRLRRGERYVRTWSVGRYLPSHAFLDRYAPYHTCGLESDRKDPVNFPFWDPYAWEDGKAASYRHAGSGFLEYVPDLRGDGWRDAAVRHANLTGDRETSRPAWHSAEGGIEGEAVFSVACPYVLTGGTLELAGRIGEPGDRITVSLARKPGADANQRQWTEVLTSTAPGAFRKRVDLSRQVEGSLDGYWLRIAIQSRQPEKTGLDSLRLRSDFQLNPYALPQLLPGKNRLFVTAARADTPWKLRLAWREGPEWITPREHAAVIRGTDYQAGIEIPPGKLPRMEALELSVDP